MNAEIIGFAGVKHSGKTTAATALRRAVPVPSAHIEFSDPIMAIARRWMAQSSQPEATPAMLPGLHAAVAESYGIVLSNRHLGRLALNDLSGYLARRHAMTPAEAEISADTKESHREVLQWLGHQMVVNVDPLFWSRTVCAQARRHDQAGVELVTIGGVRYANDARPIRALPGTIVEVVRPGIISDGDPREGDLTQADIDITILNDADESGLAEKMVAVWENLRTGGK